MIDRIFSSSYLTFLKIKRNVVLEIYLIVQSNNYTFLSNWFLTNRVSNCSRSVWISVTSIKTRRTWLPFCYNETRMGKCTL